MPEFKQSLHQTPLVTHGVTNPPGFPGYLFIQGPGRGGDTYPTFPWICGHVLKLPQGRILRTLRTGTRDRETDKEQLSRATRLLPAVPPGDRGQQKGTQLSPTATISKEWGKGGRGQTLPAPFPHPSDTTQKLVAQPIQPQFLLGLCPNQENLSSRTGPFSG